MLERFKIARDDDTVAVKAPVIDRQDLEHKPGPDTRVDTRGLKVMPELAAAWNGESESSERR